MSYRIVDISGEWTDRQTGTRAVMAEVAADTAADLPTNTSDLVYVIGSWARTIDTGDIYRINSFGSWVLQPSTNVWQNVYTKAEVDSMVNTIYQTMMYYHTAQESTEGSIIFYTLGTPVGSLTIYGNGEQNGIPSPDNIIIPDFCGVRTANLWDEDYTGISSSIKYVPLNVGNGSFTLSTTAPLQGETSAALFLLAGNVSSGATDSNKVYLGNPLTVATIDGYVTIAFHSLATVNPADYDTMLNLGSTALPYEPFGYKIPVSCGGETTPVYLGEVPTVRRIKKLVLTGTEDIRLETAETNRTVYYLYVNNFFGNFGFCTHIEWKSTYQPTEYDRVVYVQDGRLFISLSNVYLSAQTVQAFKAFLADQYSAGTPITVWYVLATPKTGIVNEPLAKIGDYADELHLTNADVDIPTVAGENTLTVDTDLKPSKIVISGESN